LKIGLLTWGSHGDIRPFVALAKGLQAAGHEVHLLIVALDPAYLAPASEPGLRITLMTPLELSPEQAEAYGQAVYRARNPITQLATLLRLCFAPAEDAIFAAARHLSAASDLLIGHYVMHPLQIAAEEASRPYISLQLAHAGIPSDYSHPIGLAGLGRLGHRLMWKLTRVAVQHVVGPYVNRLRRKAGLSPVRDVIGQVWLSSQLNLVAVSPQLCRRQPDWPETVQICGFLDMPNTGIEAPLPPALAAFLAAGEAPVYMTLGSWMPADRRGQTQTLALLSQAAMQANCRAIIQCHDWQACGFESDERLLFVGHAPHQLIFPQCRAVVHHGGAGTTQSATQAGVPSIVIAHLSEQQFWARELQRIGVAFKRLDRRSVSAVRLAIAIRRVLAAPALLQRAREVAAAMRGENGVAEAVRWIGQYGGR